LPSASAPPPARAPGADLRSEIEALERARVSEALQTCAGNQSEAARILGMSRRTLVKRLSSWGFPRPRARREVKP